MLRTILPPLGLALLSLLTACATSTADAADPAATGDFAPPVHLTTQQDHQRMLDLLQIKSLRPGVDGMNPKAPNAANYDEAKANLRRPATGAGTRPAFAGMGGPNWPTFLNFASTCIKGPATRPVPAAQ